MLDPQVKLNWKIISNKYIALHENNSKINKRIKISLLINGVHVPIKQMENSMSTKKRSVLYTKQQWKTTHTHTHIFIWNKLQ